MMFAESKASDRRGFTIIEMLAVLFILAIVVALIASVSVYVLNEANKTETRSSMAVIYDALLLYIDIYRTKPDYDGWCTRLYQQLIGDPQTAAKIRELPDTVFPNQSPRVYFCDAWGKQLRYKQTGGRGDAPVLISAGPDGAFDTDDDIRSDQP